MSEKAFLDETADQAETSYIPRSKHWIGLLKSKGWLDQGKIVLPPDVTVYLYFPPATTDINTIESISLQRVTEITEQFVIHRVSAYEEEYYLWEDVQCLRIRTKKASRAKK